MDSERQRHGQKRLATQAGLPADIKFLSRVVLYMQRSDPIGPTTVQSLLTEMFLRERLPGPGLFATRWLGPIKSTLLCPVRREGNFQIADHLAKTASRRNGPNDINIDYRTHRVETVQLACRLASEIWAQYLCTGKLWIKEQATYWTREKAVKLKEIPGRPPFPCGMHHFAREGERVWCTACGKDKVNRL